MAIENAGLLYQLIGRQKLLTDDQLGQLRARAKKCLGARQLANELVDAGWLTRYQTELLLNNRASDLAFGPYQILDRLGEGGLSKVYKAKHLEYDLTVALKIMRREALKSDAGLKQFLQEIEAMVELDHPNIVAFCDLDEVDGQYYYAMEYVTGKDLGKWVLESGPLPIWQACDFARQTALGLQHAHEHNLVHRDIKPLNLYAVTPQSHATDENPRHTIKILDWGLACLKSVEGNANTPTENVLGTADFIAPEQALNSNNVDIRADIYSLGCTLYFLLAGQPPFPGDTLAKKLILHQTSEPAPIKSLRQEVPPQVGAILRRMMAKKTADRYRTPDSVAVALQPFTTPTKANSVRSSYLSRFREEIRKNKNETPLPSSLKRPTLLRDQTDERESKVDVDS